MTRLLRLSLCLLCLLAAGRGLAQTSGDFLTVDQAFEPRAERTAAGDIVVTWSIADGYYLYRHALDFALVAAGAATLGPPSIPDGDTHQDEFFGEVETYRDRLQIVLPVTEPLPADAALRLQYQGCADAGLCYPPETRRLALDGSASQPAGMASAAPSADPAGASESAAAGQAAPEFVTPQDDLARRLADANTLYTLAAFFGLGLLLAFTPCILPMIPILSGLIVGAQATPRRALGLSIAYVLAMAVAYTVFGVIAGYFGANLQAALQMPAVVIGFAAVFVLLALGAFGVFSLQMPGVLRERLGDIGTRRGGIVGAATMGFFAALIAGPCLAPPLVGALLYIARSGDMWLGGAALFLLGLGMGLPLIAIGVFGARVLPRSGAWMREMRVASGVILIAVAIWLSSRLLAPDIALAAWALLALAYASYLSTASLAARGARVVQRAAVFLLFVYAGTAAVGVLTGDGRPLAPLAGFTAPAGPTAGSAVDSPFERVDDLDQLQAALSRAAANDRPAVVDFYADWCVECVEMEHGLFAEPAVRDALDDVAALQVDVTDYDGADRRLMRALDVFGPPTVLFHDGDGAELADQRLIGKTGVDDFLARLRRAARRTP